MDTSRYQAFFSAAETGSIKNAAEELGYTPSGVSQLIKGAGGRTGIYTALSKQKGVSLTLEGRRLGRQSVNFGNRKTDCFRQHRRCRGCLSVRLTLLHIGVWRRCGCHR